MSLLIRLLINAAALWAAVTFVPGIDYFGPLYGLLLVALVFGVLNAIVRPILGLLTCPLQMITLGLFTLVLNAIMLWLTAEVSQYLGLDFRVNGAIAAFLGALLITIVSIVLSIFVRDRR